VLFCLQFEECEENIVTSRKTIFVAEDDNEDVCDDDGSDGGCVYPLQFVSDSSNSSCAVAYTQGAHASLKVLEST